MMAASCRPVDETVNKPMIDFGRRSVGAFQMTCCWFILLPCFASVPFRI